MITFQPPMDKQDETELIQETINLIQLLKKVYKDTSYNIVRLGAGLHRDAKRIHTHIAFIISYKSKKKPILHWSKQTDMVKLKKNVNQTYDMEVTQYLDTDLDYSEETGIAYAFKEYEKFEDVIMKEEFIDLDDELIESLRNHGNKKYRQVKAENERTEKRKLMAENEAEEIEQFISSAILEYDYKNNLLLGYEETEHLHGKRYEEFSIKDKYIFVKYQIIEYFGIKAEKSGKPIIKMAKKNQVNDYAYMFLAKDKSNRWEMAKFFN